ncbi:MAG: enoyl-CoA hydratase-related protein, partial [bacterium]
MSYETITLVAADRIATITVNRPDKLNALNDQVVADLARAAAELKADAAVRGVILTGAGPKAFIAGADIGDLAKQGVMDGRARA